MTTFATEFLGCKVSLADAQTVRERLIGDGHVEAESAAVRVVNTCCVTAEAVAKSRKAVRRAARSAERVFVTGCAANLEGAFDGLEPNVTVVAARAEPTPDIIAEAVGTLGLHRCRADLCPHSSVCTRAGRLLVLVQLLRDSGGSRCQPKP